MEDQSPANIPTRPPRGNTLEAEFLAALDSFPEFAGRALQTYPFAQDQVQAVQIAWRAVALSERPEDQSRHQAMRQRLGPLGFLDALALELFVQHIITTGIGDKVRAGSLWLTGVHPEHGRRYEPDPALLDQICGHDRFRNQLTDGAGRVVIDLRLGETEPARAPGQLALPLADPGRNGAPANPAPELPSEEQPADPPKLTPTKLVTDYIAERVAAKLDYSGRGAIAERDCHNLQGQPGFGNKALTDLVMRARANAGRKPNRGGHGSKG
jgi:hypothetical protein